ncbi:tRNA lysidine(34) synthetase TilS [Propionibacterium sp.]|uniref:tRNA lysidine(34) synthetase TilS n=1 Tax=Propionibacterium sp. TaxID=1977903 RepID=UPI0039E8F548
MTVHALSPACLAVVSAVRGILDAARDGELRVRVGCSGGPDSLALAAAVAWQVRREPELRAEAMVVDHQLQEGSGQVAREAVQTVTGLGLPARMVRVSVDPQHPDGPEAAARSARYQALCSASPAFQLPDLLLLGHTLDDQAETVLLGLARGSGIRSLAGMAPSSGRRPRMVRPLLGLRRAQTHQACTDWGLKPWTDPQNRDDCYTRARVRARVMPMLDAEFGRDMAKSLARTAQLARADADLLDELARDALDELLVPGTSHPGLDCKGLAGRPPALRGRIVRVWLTRCGVLAPDFQHTSAVLGLVLAWHGQKGVSLAGGCQVVRRDGHLELAAPGLQ